MASVLSLFSRTSSAGEGVCATACNDNDRSMTVATARQIGQVPLRDFFILKIFIVDLFAVH